MVGVANAITDIQQNRTEHLFRIGTYSEASWTRSMVEHKHGGHSTEQNGTRVGTYSEASWSTSMVGHVSARLLAPAPLHVLGRAGNTKTQT